MLRTRTGTPRLLVFTDLDGTLLDHRDYSYAPAGPALAALKRRGIPLVLASSKTAAEIAPLHAELGLGATPAIVENGAALFRPGAPDIDGAAHARLRAALAALPAGLRRRFRGVSDMTDAELAALTGLTPAGARLAKRRSHSEPGIWSGSDADLARFRRCLAESGISMRRGGRFLTLGFGGCKAGRMAEVAAGLGAEVTIALGDAPNDVEMLEAADHGVVVLNDAAPQIPPLAGEASGRITRTALPGPAGWNAAVLSLLATLSPEGDHARHG